MWPANTTKAKTGGRLAGTPNRRTIEMTARLEASGFDPLKDLIEQLPLLSPKERASVDLQLLTYLYPRRKALELTVEEPTNSGEEDRLVKERVNHLMTMMKDLVESRASVRPPETVESLLRKTGLTTL